MRVLVVEDAPDLVEIIGLSLSIRWPDTEVLDCSSGSKAIHLAETEALDLVILDLGLPDVDGLEVLSAIRGMSRVPVIVVTGRAAVTDRVKGLEMGADDYIAKPFSQTELVARVNAVLRHDAMGPGDGNATQPPRRVEGPGIVIDLGGPHVHIEGKEVNLTPTEWHMLELLVQNEGRVVPHDMLAKQVWGTEHLDPSTIKMGVRRLRLKLGDSAQLPRVIRTHRGMGYSFDLGDRTKD